MKNKKGFTLVELIIVITLTISVTAIAVVSITNINKKKKEEAYELVKEQVENAAEEYFSNNEYLFESMTDEAEGYISVGRLVNEGLLNAVTDPRTGKKIKECTLVKVTKDDGRFNLSFDETINKDNCDNNKYIVTINPEPEKYKSPTIDFLKDGTKGKNDWYKNITGVKVDVKVDKQTEINILKRGTDTIEENKYNNFAEMDDYKKYEIDETSIYLNDGIYVVNYEVYDINGGYISKTLNLNIDGTPPSLEYKEVKNASTDIESVTWTNSKATFKVTATDEGSGIDPEGLSGSKNKGLFAVVWNNTNETTFDNSDLIYINGSTEEGKNAKIEEIPNGYERTDGSLSGEGERIEAYKVCDKAGNCTEKIIYAFIDKTKPYFQITPYFPDEENDGKLGCEATSDYIREGNIPIFEAQTGDEFNNSVLVYSNFNGRKRYLSSSLNLKTVDGELVSDYSGDKPSSYKIIYKKSNIDTCYHAFYTNVVDPWVNESYEGEIEPVSGVVKIVVNPDLLSIGEQYFYPSVNPLTNEVDDGGYANYVKTYHEIAFQEGYTCAPITVWMEDNAGNKSNKMTINTCIE